jgi:hypothetical protein
MKINQFSSYFEIFAGLNLAYAGFESFSVYTLKLLRGRITDLESINELKETLTASRNSLSDGENKTALDGNINAIIPELEKKQIEINKQLAKSDKELEEVSRSFTSSFIICSLFCLAVLLVGGIEQIWDAKPESISTSKFLLILNVVLIYIGLNSFLPESWSFPILKESNFIRVSLIFAFVGVLFTLGYFNAIWDTSFIILNESFIFSLTIFTACSSFICGLPRIVSHLRKFNSESKPILTDIKEKIKALETLHKDDVARDLSKTSPNP